MKKPRQLRRRASSQQGQAIVEFIIMLSMAVTVVASTAVIFRRSIFRMWVFMAKDISAACPGCPAEPNVR